VRGTLQIADLPTSGTTCCDGVGHEGLPNFIACYVRTIAGYDVSEQERPEVVQELRRRTIPNRSRAGPASAG